MISVDPNSAGITGGTVNLTLSAVAELMDIDHGTVFNELTTGKADAASGSITDLGGNTLLPGAGATPTWALLGRVSIFTLAPGDAVFSVGPGSLRFSLSGGHPPLDFSTEVLLGPAHIVAVGESAAFGDFDCDGNANLDDFIIWLDCLTAAGMFSPACDGNSDGIVDLLDFATFQIVFTGGGL